MFDPVHFWPSLILSDLVWSGLILSDPVRFWPANLGIFGPNLWDPQKHREPQNLTIPLFSSLDHPEILIIITKLEFDCVISKFGDFSKTSQKVWILNKIISEYFTMFKRYTFPPKKFELYKVIWRSWQFKISQVCYLKIFWSKLSTKLYSEIIQSILNL